MAVLIRADASFAMGSGHIMRCLTLADRLKGSGHDAHFICKAHSGNLIAYIRSRGYAVSELPCHDSSDGDLAHAHWLGGSWEDDAEATRTIIRNRVGVCEWIVLDHYGLDYRWQNVVKDDSTKLLVIDDLADRNHDCDVLLDQTHGQASNRYNGLIPKECRTLLGANFALLREQFSQARLGVLAKRKSRANLKRILVSMGGADPDNLTGEIVQALEVLHRDRGFHLTVLMGQNARHREAIEALADENLTVLVAVEDMASLMLEVDVAIGTAGTTSWERCCMGLPTVMIISAENQRLIAQGLVESGAAVLAGEVNHFNAEGLCRSVVKLLEDRHVYYELVDAAASICDGRGVYHVLEAMCLQAA